MIRLAFILSLLTSPALAQLPDGTLVFSNKPGTVIGNVAQRMATKAQGYHSRYTHVGIVLDGVVYHSDYPRVTTRSVHARKRFESMTYQLPARQYTPQQIASMKAYARSQLGQPYRLRGFLRRDGSEGWCSTFVGQVLNQAGHNMTKQQRFTPDNLLRAIR
jgi:hypothetical protein